MIKKEAGHMSGKMCETVTLAYGRLENDNCAEIIAQ